MNFALLDQRLYKQLTYTHIFFLITHYFGSHDTLFLLRLSSTPVDSECGARSCRSGRKGARGERRREAIVDGENFKTVGSALVIAEMAVKFLQFSAQFPAIGTDVLTRIGELLRVSI